MEEQIQFVAEKFSEELLKVKNTSPLKRRYSEKFKKAICSLIKQGAPMGSFKKYMGIHRTSLVNWYKDYETIKSSESSFKEISVFQNTLIPLARYTIETPSGYKIHLNSRKEIPLTLNELEKR